MGKRIRNFIDKKDEIAGKYLIPILLAVLFITLYFMVDCDNHDCSIKEQYQSGSESIMLQSGTATKIF